jgi:GT2 family glycosyltransferase
VIGKILSAKEQGILTPLLDEKGCANKKSALIKAGLFDTKQFTTAGEDFDMYLKLSRMGEIAYPDTKIIHYHKHTWKNRIGKELQLSNAFGALVRIHGTKLPRWYVGVLKAVPFLGWLIFLAGINIKKLKFLSLLAVPIYLLFNFIYSIGFWKGFFNKIQTQLL